MPLADIGAALHCHDHLPFPEWGQEFPNLRLRQALVDRLTDRAHIIETGTESFRLLRTLPAVEA